MKRFAILLLAGGVFISSCNLPTNGQSDSQIATAAALTVQAAINAVPLPSPTSDVPTVVGVTPTFSQPLITVEDVTNCRSGPGVNYERVIQITAGQQVKVIGIYPPGYWIVSTTAGDCWVNADFATPMGSVQTVPTVTAPPTPEGKPPATPTFPKNGWNYFCFGSGDMEVSFTWKDNADNETGYRILRNGEMIAELPVNSTQFSDKIILLSGQSATYQIEAYNVIGFSRSSVVTLTC